jgi:hypothetical protein
MVSAFLEEAFMMPFASLLFRNECEENDYFRIESLQLPPI